MVKVHVERIIDVPIERAWDILGDFSNVHKIHPLVKTVDQKTDKDRGVGAIRQCNMYDGNRAVEKIEEWDESNHAYVIRLIDSSLPMKSILVKLHAVPQGLNKSKLVAEMNMKAKFGLLGKIMERVVMKPQLGGAIGNLFAGIESYDKDGMEIQQGFKASTPALVY